MVTIYMMVKEKGFAREANRKTKEEITKVPPLVAFLLLAYF